MYKTIIFFFTQVEDFSLHHVGSLETAECSGYSCVDESEENSGGEVLSKMLPIIYRTRNGPTHNKARTSSSQDQPLFAVAMEMKLDKERNSTVGFNHSEIIYAKCGARDFFMYSPHFLLMQLM